MATNEKELNKWQGKYLVAKNAYEKELAVMKRSIAQYKGDMQPVSGKGTITLYNVTAEMIESTIDTNVPPPKVEPNIPTERNKRLARVIEDMLRSEMKRLKFDALNDEDERMTRIAGGDICLLEWNNTIRAGRNAGAVSTRLIQPTQFIPQAHLTNADNMEYVFLDYDVTKESVERKYGVSVEKEGLDSSHGTDENGDLVTQHYAFYRGKNGVIGCYSWVGSTEIFSEPIYSARGNEICRKCGKPRQECECGSKSFRKEPADYEEITEDIVLSDRVIPAMSYARDEFGGYKTRETESQVMDGISPVFEQIFDEQMNVIGEKPMTVMSEEAYLEPTKIRYYRPSGFPVAIRKNVSMPGKFLGESDCVLIYEMQDKMNKVATKMVDKLTKEGSILTKPKGLNFNFSNGEQVLEVTGADQISMIQVRNMSFDTQKDINFLNQAYAWIKSLMGISDTFQGKADYTAQSAAAKELQVQRALGRQQSKISMKNLFYSEIYRKIFEYMLAYSDEPRKYASTDADGNETETVFNRYEFLEKDEKTGEWYYNDDFTFSIDPQGSSKESRQYILNTMDTDFKAGLYGDQRSTEAILNLWKDRESMGYPNSSRQVARWKAKLEAENEMRQMPSGNATQPQDAGGGLGLYESQMPELQEGIM